MIDDVLHFPFFGYYTHNYRAFRSIRFFLLSKSLRCLCLPVPWQCGNVSMILISKSLPRVTMPYIRTRYRIALGSGKQILNNGVTHRGFHQLLYCLSRTADSYKFP